MNRPVIFSPSRLRGFTLIETAMATMIIGLGLVASIQLFATCTQQNRVASQMSVATMLAQNIQEATGGLSFADPGVGHTHFGSETGESLATFNDVDDFDGQTFTPPINSQRQQIAEMSQYLQVVSVWPVNPNKLSINSNESTPDIPKTSAGPYTGAIRVRVRILFRVNPTDVPVEVYRASWIRLDN